MILAVSAGPRHISVRKLLPENPLMSLDPSTGGTALEAQYHVPATGIKRLSQNDFLPVSTNFPLDRAFPLDGISIRGHGGPGDLRVGLVVVAAVDGEVARTAVAKAPAPARFVAQGGIAGHVPEVVCDLAVGTQIGPLKIWDLTVDGDLVASQHKRRLCQAGFQVTLTGSLADKKIS